MASLVFVEGEAVLGLTVALGAEVVLGRDVACTVPLPSDDVSRRHARVVPEGDGHLLLDLGSTNGTWVNGRVVERHHLAAGDRVQVGGFVAAYVAPGDPAGRQLQELARLARRDALTGLANRRAFDEELARATARAAREGTPLSALLLDVDRFKQVNDGHGHATGDAVLAGVAARTAAALRVGDLVARVGGEEFAILLPGADLARAAEAGERIRAGIAASPIAAGALALAITASVGCATLREGDADGRALLARADACLYEAKRTGRNKVVC